MIPSALRAAEGTAFERAQGVAESPGEAGSPSPWPSFVIRVPLIVRADAWLVGQAALLFWVLCVASETLKINHAVCFLQWARPPSQSV